MKLFNIRSMIASGKSIYDMTLKVCVYARVSTEHIEQKQSLVNQVEHFKSYILSNKNWIYVNSYIDNGISGTSDVKRESFMQMISDAKNGYFDLIITKEISRFSRNTLDSIKYTRLLLSYGVGVYFFSDNINTFFLDSEFRLTIMASMAQDEVRRLSQRVKFGMERAIERGEILGNDMLYGYKKNKFTGNLEIIDSEAEFVRTIFNLYVYKRYSLGKIAKYLNNCCEQKRWYSSTVSRIIENPKYKGFYCGGKVKVVDYITKKKEFISNSNWIMYKDFEKIPPIVEEELWDLANKRFLSRKKNNRKGEFYKDRYIFSGKILCENDNSFYHRRYLKNDISLMCGNYLRYGKSCCDSVFIRECELKVILFDFFSFINIDYIQLTNYLNNLYNENNSFSYSLYNLLKKKSMLINRRNKLIDLNINELITDNDFKNKILENNEDIKTIDQEIDGVFKETNSNSVIVDNSFFSLFCDTLISLMLEKIVVLKKSFETNIYLSIYLNYEFSSFCKKYVFKRGNDVSKTKRYEVTYYVMFTYIY